MKRLVITLILGLVLVLTLGSSVALAASPDYIFVDPGNKVIIVPDSDGIPDGPPDITIKTPQGARPPDHTPPG